MNYDANQQLILGLVLAVMIFGVSLELRIGQFFAVLRQPQPVLAGMLGQCLILPWATLAVTLLVDLHPGLELGLLLVACCPGGNLSNVMTHLARGNTALSMSMTALSSLLALVLLPLNFALTSGLNPEASAYLAGRLSALQMDRGSILVSVVLLLGLPLLAGMLVGNLWPRLAERVMPWFKRFSLVAFVVFVGGAVAGNWRMFVDNLGLVFFIVVLHNASAIVLGWAMAKLARQRGANLRAMVIEISMHNSGLALGLIFAQFGGEPNMALVAAFWGTWHLVSGLLLVAFWRNRPLPVAEGGVPCAS
ncbi:bile acid:sodium symporter family protein [Pseudomonas sp. PDM13]|uniref:bile acid:sodium symporter family protein n=1 Tax=Pseudomonas sp. PDM13 TaxID=2769255 RepID=UPI0021E08447|nr:bile acid:sodium symporter family protein [Pseudomonas sp. PDM13]MCU9946342.1 bile acid:sodium symporter family protein [Pseudomonas sp. PDM13]